MTGDAPNWADTDLRTANGTWMTVGRPETKGDPADYACAALPDAQANPADAFETLAVNPTADSVRLQQVYFRTAADKTLSLPTALGTASVDPGAGGAYLRPIMTFTPVSDAIPHRLQYLADGDAGVMVDGDVTVTRDWLGSTAAYRLPNYAWLEGWMPAWGPQRLEVATRCHREQQNLPPDHCPLHPAGTADRRYRHQLQRTQASVTSRRRGDTPAPALSPRWTPPLTPP